MLLANYCGTEKGEWNDLLFFVVWSSNKGVSFKRGRYSLHHRCNDLLYRMISYVACTINAFQVGVLAYIDFYVAMLINFYATIAGELVVGGFADLHKHGINRNFACFARGVVNEGNAPNLLIAFDFLHLSVP